MMGISALTSLPARIGVAFVIAFMIGAFGYMKGREDEKINQLKANIEAFKARDKTDENISNLNDVGLCVELSLMSEQQCRELLGLEETPNPE